MINTENYAEVSRVLGQNETDKQLAFLGKALCEALPQLKNDPNFTSAAENLYKMVDDQTTRVRTGQQKLTDTQHAHRKYYDD